MFEETMLVHLFSNGGTHKTAQLTPVYAQRFQKKLPARAMVFDSTPKKRNYTTFSKHFDCQSSQNPLVRMLGMIITYFVLFLIRITIDICGRENVVTKAREVLNDSELIRQKVPRCYLYSEVDEMMWWEGVEEHALEAEKKGWTISRVKFHRSGHVNRLKEDAGRYWGVIKTV